MNPHSRPRTVVDLLNVQQGASGGQHPALDLPRALWALAHEAVVTKDRPHPLAEREAVATGGASPFSPAVPPACHKQRSPAVSSGQPRSLTEGLCAWQASLTWGGGGGRNCMACKGSPVVSVVARRQLTAGAR
jgi:hypothetical protein